MIPITPETATETAQKAAALLAPFPPDELRWKPQAVKNNRCLAIAYIGARVVMDRLDAVLGVENWQDEYDVLADGSAACRLKVRFAPGGEWVMRMDVGSPSEQPDGGDRLKAAFSDALKRAAVKLGVGRYLYRLPHQWVEYDPARKQIVQLPQLPAWAVPGKQRAGLALPARAGESPAPGQQPPKAGGPTHPELVATIAGAFAAVCNRKGYLELCNLVAADVKAGALTQADRDSLAVAARACAARFPAPAAKQGA